MDRWWKIDSPASGNEDGAGARAYYSGHYIWHGVILQSCCDTEWRFTWVSANCPGGMNDVRAHRSSSFAYVVGKLERGLYIVSDNTDRQTATLVPPFTRPEIRDVYMNSYNFRLSQLRIRTEMVFEFLAAKWRIFRQPRTYKPETATRILLAAAVSHTDTIHWRVNYGEGHNTAQEDYLAIRASEPEGFESILTYAPSTVTPTQSADTHSCVRDMLVEKIRVAGLLRHVQ